MLSVGQEFGGIICFDQSEMKTIPLAQFRSEVWVSNLDWVTRFLAISLIDKYHRTTNEPDSDRNWVSK